MVSGLKTVATHIQNIYLKTGVNKKDDLLDMVEGYYHLMPEK